MAQAFHKRIDRAALTVSGERSRGTWTAHEIVDLTDRLARDRGILLQAVQDRDAEIARLKLSLDTSATGTIDVQLLELLKHMSYHDAVEHVLLVRGPKAGSALWVDLCVKEGSAVIPYKRAKIGAASLHEAAAHVLNDYDPRIDVVGMCDGLRKMHGAT